MAKRVLAGFLATSDPIEGRRHQLTEQDIRDLAEHVTVDDRLHLSHDERVVIPTRLVKAELRRTDSGSLGLWVEHEMEEEDAALLPSSYGYSVAFSREASPGEANSDLPEMQLVVDGANFSDEDFDGALADLRKHFNVSAGWMQQYSELPPPHVFIALGIQFVATIPVHLLRSLIVDAIKNRFFRPASMQPTVFTFSLREMDKEIKARIETSDPEIFGQGVELLRDAIDSESHLVEYDAENDTWKHVR